MKNHYQMATSQSAKGSFATRLLGVGIVALPLVALLFSGSVQAATPIAGTLISNTAHATYANAGGAPQTPVDSNTVQTTVAPVGTYTLTNSQDFDVSPGDTKFLLHTVTNNGNTDDVFHITVPLAVPSSLTTVQVIRDDNNDGIHQTTETTVLCTVTGSNTCAFDTPNLVAGGGSYNFFVQAIVAAGATVGDVATANVVATPATPAVYDSTHQSLTNTDRLTVKATVFDVQKSITTGTSGTWNSTAGATITYRLAYSNTGTAAGPLYLEDTIGTGTTVGFLYKADSTAVWNNGTTTTAGGVLTDTSGASDDGTGIHYTVTGTPGTAPNTIKVYVENVAPGASGYVEFNVKVASVNVATGTSQTNNTASFGIPTNCTTGTCTSPVAPTSTSPTNSSAFQVLVSGAFILEKFQAPAIWDTGTSTCAAPVPAEYVKTGISQTPGNCIWYKVIATNGSNANVTSVTINDTTPSNTTYAGAPGGVVADVCTEDSGVLGTVTAVTPTVGQVGTVDCSTWTTVPATKTTTLEFAVRVNP